jgi:hypothetical protein
MSTPFPILPGGDKSPIAGLQGFGLGGGGPLSFDFRHINWLAHIFGNTLVFPEDNQIKEIIHAARQYLFWLNQHGNQPVRSLAFQVVTDLQTDWNDYSRFVYKVGAAFRALPWRALLIPGGFDSDDDTSSFQSIRGQSFENEQRSTVDDLLTSRTFVENIFKSNPSYHGLIFYLSNTVKGTTYLENIYPALKVAFASACEWPRIVLWHVRGDAASFFPLRGDSDSVKLELASLFSGLFSREEVYNDGLIKPPLPQTHSPRASKSQSLHIIHTSDMHLGSEVAESRLVTVKNRIQEIVATLKGESKVVPIVTGDLMDTPGTRHLNSLEDYLHFLNNLGTERPLIVPGNHDVRHSGVVGEKLDEITRLYMKPVVFTDDCKVGLLCFNSVRSGNLARGNIDEREFASLGQELDLDKKRSSSYFLLALVHHHPCPVELPDWYVRTWYERWLGKWFERTEELENAKLFLEWLKNRRVAVVLHGHKHIPRVTEEEGITVIGCGSTVGKVRPDSEGHTFMSMNVMTINVETRLFSCRLLAERIVGAGLNIYDTHEILLRGQISKSSEAFAGFGKRLKSEYSDKGSQLSGQTRGWRT